MHIVCRKYFFEFMLVEMFSKIFFQNNNIIYWDVFENLTFQNLPAIPVATSYSYNYTSFFGC